MTIWSIFQQDFSSQFAIYKALQYVNSFTQLPINSTIDSELAILYLANEVAPYLHGRSVDDITRYIHDSLSTFNTPKKHRFVSPSYSLFVSSFHSRNSEVSDQRLESDQAVYSASKQQPDDVADSYSSLNFQRETGSLLDCHYADNLRRIALSSLKSYKRFAEGSSDVVSTAWSTNGTFAMGCTTYNDIYNAPGNLLLGDAQRVQFLDGHYVDRPAEQGNEMLLSPKLYSTVSGVAYSSAKWYSASYDTTVKVWSEEGKLLNTLDFFRDRMINIYTHDYYASIFAAGSADGSTHVVLTDQAGKVVEKQVFHASDANIEPCVMAWASEHLIVGYDGKVSGSGRGDFRVFDVKAESLYCCLHPGATPIFDLCLDPGQTLLVAGAMAQRNKRQDNIKTHVRVWDWSRTSLGQPVIEFDSPQLDLNKVTIR